MNDVYHRLNSSLTYQDLTIVFSAVFKNVYWVEYKMDAQKLSKNLQEALGLSSALADQYAQTAINQWRGMFCRTDLQDMGTIPRTEQMWSSLDVILQNSKMPVQPFIANWEERYFDQAKVGKNYVYLRGQNLKFDGELNPEVEIYSTKGGFNQPITQNDRLFTADGSNQTGKMLPQNKDLGKPFQEGARGCSEAFVFNPTDTDHVCLVGIIKTEAYFENEVPTVPNPGNWYYKTWVQHNGAVAWHNANPQTASLQSLKFYNQDSSTEKFKFLAKCQNVPVGSIISMSHQSETVKFHSKDITITNPNQLIELETNLPGSYEGDLEIRMEDPDGNMLPPNAAVEFSMEWVLSKGHQHYLDAMEQFGNIKSFAVDQAIGLTMGTYTIYGQETK